MSWKEASGAAGLELLELSEQQASLEAQDQTQRNEAEAMAQLVSAMGQGNSELTPAQREFYSKYLHRAQNREPTRKGFTIEHEHRVPNVK
jgi:hypothetical protein